jgi:hypothetical protein
MATILKTKNSVTAASAPSSLAQGELAVNITDKKMWVGNASSTPVQIVGSGATNAAGGSNTQVQYNSSGSLAGSANMTFSGTALTLANDASISGLTVGKGGGSVATNTVIGNGAQNASTTGTGNTEIGYQAGYAGTSAGANTLLGYRTGYALTSGGDNTFVGYQAGLSSTTPTENTAVGSSALRDNTTGAYNIAVGRLALAQNTTASNNTAVGYQAGYSNTTGTNLVALGYQAGYTGTANYADTYVGWQAGYAKNTALDNAASTMIGYRAGYGTTSGIDNSFVGGLAGLSNTSGSYNTALGSQALRLNTTGSNNTAVGYQAAYTQTNGTYNVAIGQQALYTNAGYSYNTAIGYQALYATSQNYNTAVGYQAGYNNTTGINNFYGGHQAGLNATGSQNVFVGSSAGNNLTTGASCTFLGFNCLASGVAVTNELVIGQGATGKGSNTGFISPNGGGVYQGNNSAAWSITSDKRLKKNIVDNTVGLDAINKIQVRNFEYRTADEVTDLPKSSAIDIKGVQIGAIAQEIQAILPDCVKEESTGVMSVDTTNLTWYLVNAVKELKAEIDQLKGN